RKEKREKERRLSVMAFELGFYLSCDASSVPLSFTFPLLPFLLRSKCALVFSLAFRALSRNPARNPGLLILDPCTA
ncbi:MAG TPA: hypothetical protein VEW72_09175, partial [Burkholderiales bacterium]|nr:hypothetical protein [Burkholderiales bacterium]